MATVDEKPKTDPEAPLLERDEKRVRFLDALKNADEWHDFPLFFSVTIGAMCGFASLVQNAMILHVQRDSRGVANELVAAATSDAMALIALALACSASLFCGGMHVYAARCALCNNPLVTMRRKDLAALVLGEDTPRHKHHGDR